MGSPLAFLLLGAALVGAAGCSARQQFTVVPIPQTAAMVAQRKVVVEAVVERSSWSAEWSLAQPFGTGTYRRDAVVSVVRVVKGGETAGRLKLSNYRPPTERELALFPDVYGIHNRSRLLLGCDSRLGSSFTALHLVPLGNTPEFNDAMQDAALVRASRAASRRAERPPH